METENQQPVEPAVAKPSPQLPWKTFLVMAALIVVVAMVFVWKGHSHSLTEATGPVVVGVAKVTREDLYNEVPIPAEFRPYVEVELHAKVSGYVDKMNVDFGDKVKSGQLLATLEVPELHDQLNNAVAVQQHAEVDYTNAHLMHTRLQEVNRQHPNLVAQQDLDTAESKDSAAAAAIAGAKADVARFQTLVKYTQITAPFDGVVTRRNVDPGALIQAGTAAETQPLLRVSDNYRLRLDFPVSVLYVKDIHVGDPVQVRVDSLHDKMFSGTITRSTDKVAMDTRTMMVEVEIPNPNLEIVPGMYAALDLKVQSRSQALAVPIGVVSGEKHPTVYVINQNSEIESRPVTLGLETPDRYEITAGLQEGEMVMLGNRTFVHPGQKVETKVVTQPTAP